MAGESLATLQTTDLTLGVGQLVTLINGNQDINAKAIRGYYTKAVGGAVNITLTNIEWQNTIFQLTGVLTGNIALIVPNIAQKFIIYNNTTGAFTVTARTSAGTGVAVTQTTRASLMCDGVDVYSAASGSVSSVATSSPITGGPITGSGTIGIQDAVADGATKGAATFTAADFNAAAGVISIDYTNGQAATSGQKGFLVAADWTTFNGKGDASTNSGTSVDNEGVQFNSTTGKSLKRATGTGLVKRTSGVETHVTAPSGVVVGDTDTQTLTAKRITRRVITLTDAATVTLNADTTDVGILTTLSQATNFANPTGTPTDGQLITLRIKSTTARALTWGSQFRGSTDLALPTTTSGGSLTDYFLYIWNAADTKFDYLSKNMGF